MAAWGVGARVVGITLMAIGAILAGFALVGVPLFGFEAGVAVAVAAVIIVVGVALVFSARRIGRPTD